MANTTNFGWETPDDTDLVKDGALAMRTLGNAIDTSLVDLKGGTTGQVLSKNTNTDMDFVWTTPQTGDITEVTAGTGLSGGGTSGAVTLTNTVATTFDAKGDLVVGTGADTFAKLTVGANNTVLTADSATATGLKWATPASGGYTQIASEALTGSAVNLNSISGTYNRLILVLTDFFISSNVTLRFRVNADQSSTYYQVGQTGSTNVNDSGTAWWVCYGTNLTTTSKKNMAVIEMENYSNTTAHKVISWYNFYEGQLGGQIVESFAGSYKSTSAISAINIFPATGTFSGGTATLWGVK